MTKDVKLPIHLAAPQVAFRYRYLVFDKTGDLVSIEHKDHEAKHLIYRNKASYYKLYKVLYYKNEELDTEFLDYYTDADLQRDLLNGTIKYHVN
jgi:hypothetical protein